MQLTVQWDAAQAVSKLRGSLQMGPGFGFGDWKRAEDKPYYREGLKALTELGCDLVRYQGWRNRPDLVVAEPEAPSDGRTSWDFSRIDPPFLDFLEANGGRPFIMNFSTPPAWLGTAEPEAVADYFARFVSWYVRGGFVDEAGVRHASDHRIGFPFWEVLNEPDLEGEHDPARYVALYDAIVAKLHVVSPDTRFIGLALASTLSDPAFTAHFLNPKNHRPGVPLDAVSYHFYAQYRPDQKPAEQAQAVFDQADQFLDTLRYVAAIRDELTPATGLMVTEIGAMNQGAHGPRPETLGFEAQLSAAMYAYLFARMAALGVEAAHVSGLVAVQPDQMWQELAMIEWRSGRPNARYWTLKLLVDELAPGVRLAPTRTFAAPPYPLPRAVLEMMARRIAVFAQGFVAEGGVRKLLLVNRATEPAELEAAELAGARVKIVDEASGLGPARSAAPAGARLTLPALAVAVATLAD
ncbi:MAG TPA: hypothetical protein VHV27_10585 [Phenylobacterium sp.]|nr:hypothetical protein [Phenylobacterium sp.]